MMKRLIAAALASSVLAGVAVAAPVGPYVGIEGGGIIVQKSTFKLPATGDSARVKHHDGWDAGGVLGYNFGAFSLEGDFAYKRAHLKSIEGTRAGGRTNVETAMLNGLVNIRHDQPLSAFVGGGAGIARVEARGYNAGGITLSDDHDRAFAFQGIAGARAALTSHIDVTLKYRYLDVPKVRLAFDGDDTKSKFRSHSLLGGLTYNIGSVAPPPRAARHLHHHRRLLRPLPRRRRLRQRRRISSSSSTGTSRTSRPRRLRSSTMPRRPMRRPAARR